MLLADTNIIIDFWKYADPKFEKIIRKHEIILCGVVRAELLHGAYSDKNRRDIHEALSLFGSLDPTAEDWEVMGDQLYEYRSHGLTIPFADAVIANVAIKNRIPIWTKDKHFFAMRELLPRLSVVETEDIAI